MEHTIDFKLTLDNTSSALTALRSMRKTLADNAHRFDEGYRISPSQILLESLYVDNNKVLCPCIASFNPEDAAEIEVELLKSVATVCNEFSFTAENNSTYSEGSVDASYDGSHLAIEEIYFPDGFVCELCCPECGESLIRFEDYKSGKTYHCDSCGEDSNLDEEYEESAPIITNRLIEIK